MGLGKTVQSCGLIQATRLIGAMHTLVIVPVTLLDQWAKEIRRFCPDCPVYIYHGSAGHRAHALRASMRQQGAVLLTSYSIVNNDIERIFQVNLPRGTSQEWLSKGGAASVAARDKPWDVVICDEAHQMRNMNTLLGKSLRKVRSGCRI